MPRGGRRRRSATAAHRAGLVLIRAPRWRSDVEPEIQRLRLARAVGLVRAVLALLFGLPALAWPFMLPFAMRFLFAAYALADGIAALVGARAAVERGRLWLGLQGAVAIAAALVAWAGVPLGEEPLGACWRAGPSPTGCCGRRARGR